MSTLSLIHSILTQILVLLGVLSPVTDLANVAYEAGDGTTLHAYLATPETGCASGCPAAIVFHAWNGLSEEPLYFADQLAEQGYVALAPDLFRGSGQRAGGAFAVEHLHDDRDAAGADGRGCRRGDQLLARA